MKPRLKMLAYARDVLAMRERGERIGLLVLAVHDWNAGKWLAGKPNVARVVVPEDTPPEGCDLSLVFGLDVLVCGVDSPAFDMAVRGALAYRAASVWIETRQGLQRVEVMPASHMIIGFEVVPPVSFARTLAARRELMLATGDWPFDQPAFAPMRAAMLSRVLGQAQAEALCSL